MSATLFVTRSGGWAIKTSAFDRDLLPIFRSLPGAKWDGPNKMWRVSSETADIPRILEVAKKNQWNVQSEILNQAKELASAIDDKVVGVDARIRAENRLFPYQREGARWLARQDRALLGDEMGLGKSNQALMAIDSDTPTLIICPASIKLTWALQEIPKWRPDREVVTVLKGRGSFRWPVQGEIVVINYDILPSKKEQDSLEAPLPGTVLIADEIHNCKGAKTRRTQAVRKLVRSVERVIGLTGTPLLNRPPELWQLLDTLNLADRAFDHFGKFYYLFQGFKSGYGTEWGSPRSEVPHLLKRVMLRRSRAEVLPNLPPKRFREVIVNDLKAGLRKKLDKILELWKKGEEITGAEMPKRLPGFEEMSEIRAELAAAKIPAMLEMIEEYEMQEEPLVVFSAHRAPIDILADRKGWGVITGSQSEEERERVKRAFQAGELKGIGLTIGAGREGITLTRASQMLFVDLAFVPAHNSQAQDRICRIGQKAEGLLYTTLVADHKLDRRLEEILNTKKTLAEATITRAEVSEKLTLSENISAINGEAVIEEAVEEQHESRPCQICSQAITVREAGERAKNPGRKYFRCQKCEWFEWENAYQPTASEREWAKRGIQYLSGRCDGAVNDDGMGFNGGDAYYGNQLAERTRQWTDREVRLAMRILPKYQGQLEEVDGLQEFLDDWKSNPKAV